MVVGVKHNAQNKRFLQIFMEYCEDTLEDVVMKKRQPPPCSRFKNISECSASWEFFVTMMCDVCRGLEHIHSREMVHRDLKLANILVIFFLIPFIFTTLWKRFSRIQCYRMSLYGSDITSVFVSKDLSNTKNL